MDQTGALKYDVVSVETSGELDRSRLNLPLSLSSLLPSPLSSAPAPPSPSEPDSGKLRNIDCHILEKYSHFENLSKSYDLNRLYVSLYQQNSVMMKKMEKVKFSIINCL